MGQDQETIERIRRAEKEFREILEREKLTFVIREELINGQRVNFGIVFTPVKEESKVVAPEGGFINRHARRIFQRTH